MAAKRSRQLRCRSKQRDTSYITPWFRSAFAAVKGLKRREDMRHFCVSAIKHHVCVSHGRKIAGAVDQQQRDA